MAKTKVKKKRAKGVTFKDLIALKDDVIKTNERIDRIVNAIETSKKLKGL